jgi:hypothetical protein
VLHFWLILFLVSIFNLQFLEAMWFLFEAFHQNFLASSFELPTPASFLFLVHMCSSSAAGRMVFLSFALLGSLCWEPSDDLCANFTKFCFVVGNMLRSLFDPQTGYFIYFIDYIIFFI